MSLNIWIILGALAIGTAIGVLTGIFGVGGGFLVTPLLNVVLGIPVPIAVGTGLMQILGVSTSGIYRRRREKGIAIKLVTVLSGGNYVGVRLGAKTLDWLGKLGDLNLMGQTVAAVDFYIMWVYFIVLLAIGCYLWQDTSRSAEEEETHRVGLFSRIRIPPYTNIRTLDEPHTSLPVLSYFGLILGYMTGLLGIGGGVIMVPALIYLVGLRTHYAAATSLALIWVSSFIGTITHASLGNTHIGLVIPLLLGGTVGVQIGINIGAKMGGHELRRKFCYIVFLAVVIVAAKIVGFVV